MKYIVENGVPGAVPGCNTVEDLQRYLGTDPHPGYRLVTCQASGNVLLVWEKDGPWTASSEKPT